MIRKCTILFRLNFPKKKVKKIQKTQKIGVEWMIKKSYFFRNTKYN